MPRTVLHRTLSLVTSLSLLAASTALAAPPDNAGGGNGNGGGGGETAPFAIIPFLPDGAPNLPEEFTTISSHITDLNEGSGVVGFAELPNDGGYAALHFDRTTGVYTSLAGDSPAAFGTNDLNQIVGTVAAADGDQAAFWSDRDAQPVLLDGLPGETRCEALDINNDGIVVGYSQSAPYQTTGVAWRVVVDDEGTVHVNGPVPLPPLSGQSYTYARRVNELLDGEAQTAGHSHAGFQSREAVLWSISLNPDGTLATPGAPEGLGKLGLNATSYSGSIGLNDAGDVCGDSDEYPFVAWANQLAGPLAVPKDTQSGWANDINNHGHVVGQLDIYRLKGYINGPGNYHPYLWKNGEMIDLEKQVDLGDWDRLWGATQVNDAGIIAGHGRYDVEFRGFLMIPN